jgi:hypothetical protein
MTGAPPERAKEQGVGHHPGKTTLVARKSFELPGRTGHAFFVTIVRKPPTARIGPVCRPDLNRAQAQN